MTSYRWTIKDKLFYLLSMIPFLLLLALTGFILYTFSPYLLLAWILLYLLVNVFQAGCCVGCPYRGKYCPAFIGVYLGNLLSVMLYPSRPFDKKFFERNARIAEIILTIFLLFPLYWLFIKAPWNVAVYLGLLLLHVLLFMPLQCSKCSYHDTCPGGKAYHAWCKLFKKNDQ
jgi:hypothetical protein